MSASGRRRSLAPVLTIALAACAGHDPSLHDLVVRYASLPVADLEAQGLRVEWRSVTRKLRIGDVVPAHPLPSVAAPPPSDRRREIELEELEFVEGEPGRLWSDVGAPVAPGALMPYGVPEDPQFVEPTETGFDVTARVLPDGRVRLELVPFDTRHAPVAASASQPAHAPAPTSVTVAPGSKVAIGDLPRAAGGSFSTIGRAAPREERVLVVEVEVLAE